jgi:hypothetical protein
MRVKTIPIAVTALVLSVAFSQTPSEPGIDRTFYYTHAKTVQDMQEVATLFRFELVPELAESHALRDALPISAGLTGGVDHGIGETVDSLHGPIPTGTLWRGHPGRL